MIDWFFVFNATFSNISAISWRPVLVVEEAGENQRRWASNMRYWWWAHWEELNIIVKKIIYIKKIYVFTFQVSEAIVEEEDEQINVDRNIEEIDDQM